MQPEMKCAVCAQPARGFHFGAFTCEGCKSFFGRTAQRGINDLVCRGEGKCDVQGSNRRACKACRFRACIMAGMDSANSRFGRRSKYFKVSMAAVQSSNPQSSSGCVSSPHVFPNPVPALFPVIPNQLRLQYFLLLSIMSQNNLMPPFQPNAPKN